MNQKIYQLHFKWTVSRGQNSYGYNICTLLVDGEKKGQCNGGGYDMTGTSFAYWIAGEFQQQLQELFKDDIADLKAKTIPKIGNYTDKGSVVNYAYPKPDKKGFERFYGVTIYHNTKDDTVRIGLDGACGFSSIERIANAIGIKLQWNKESDRYKNHTYYTAIYTPIE